MNYVEIVVVYPILLKVTVRKSKEKRLYGKLSFYISQAHIGLATTSGHGPGQSRQKVCFIDKLLIYVNCIMKIKI